jgi:hypothetical protein
MKCLDATPRFEEIESEESFQEVGSLFSSKTSMVEFIPYEFQNI